MELKDYLPIWNKLTTKHQTQFLNSIQSRHFSKGEHIQNNSMDCSGLILVHRGQLRAYILSNEGKEITLYRLFERDICLFSASCMLNSIQFDVSIQVEKDADVWIIPSLIYKQILEQSAPLANYTNEIMASRFSEVMWLIDQILWKSLDRRLADFLLNEINLEDKMLLNLTHESIANHLGSSREVITRMLRYFQNEGVVKLNRGTIEILDIQKLEKIAEM